MEKRWDVPIADEKPVRLHVLSPKVQPPFSEQSDVEMAKVRSHLPLS